MSKSSELGVQSLETIGTTRAGDHDSEYRREQGVRSKAARVEPGGLANVCTPECLFGVSARRRGLLQRSIRERVSRHYGKIGSPFMQIAIHAIEPFSGGRESIHS